MGDISKGCKATQQVRIVRIQVDTRLWVRMTPSFNVIFLTSKLIAFIAGEDESKQREGKLEKVERRKKNEREAKPWAQAKAET